MKISPALASRVRSGVLLVLIAAAPTAVESAQPVISGLSGTIQEGQSITITGSNFGAVGPKVEVFDNFERGPNGAAVAVGAGSATVGEWDYRESVGVTYSNTASISGAMCMRNDYGAAEGPNVWHYFNSHSGNPPAAEAEGVREVFVAFWLRVNNDFPRESSGGVSNFKTTWLQGQSIAADDDRYIPAFWGNLSGNCYSPERVAAAGCNKCAGNGCDGYSGGDRWNSNLCLNQWIRIWYHVNNRWPGESPGGFLHLWELASSGVQQKLNYSGATGCAASQAQVQPPSVWTQISIPGMGYHRDGSPSNSNFDDVYVASGSGAAARVEIGNNSNYNSCTKLAITTPTSWADGQVTTTVRLGQFRSGEAAYLFVINPGEEISAGRSITIGGGGAPPPDTPPAPDNLHRTD